MPPELSRVTKLTLCPKKQRNIPVRGLRPVYYMLAFGAVMAYGWRQTFIGQREKLELGREKIWARLHLIPLLQAEEDRDQVRRHYADLAREQELLGSQSTPYNSDRYVRLFLLLLWGFVFYCGLVGRGRGFLGNVATVGESFDGGSIPWCGARQREREKERVPRSVCFSLRVWG